MSALSRAKAIRADAVHFQAVPVDAKTVLCSHAFDDFRHIDCRELNERIALTADEMIVFRIAVVVFVDFTAIRPSDPPQQAAIDHEIQCAIDGGPADRFAARRSEPLRELIGIEMLVVGKDFFGNPLPFMRQPLAFCREEFAEFVHGRDSDFDSRQTICR